ncbi:MAG: polysaccharide deacetylase family protein, partial [Actinomycetota bacterium]
HLTMPVPAPRPLVVAVNYHRIGDRDPDQPLHRLHTVATDVFEAHLDTMANRGPFIALGDLDHPDQLAPINFTLSFDDVPTSAATGLDILTDRSIPATVAVCTKLAEAGHGIRDEVYVICHVLGDGDIYDILHPSLGDLLPARDTFSFYYWSKSDLLPHQEMQARAIDPLLAEVGDPLADAGHRGYMSWDQLAHLAGQDVTIANHGHSHANYAALTANQIAQDITGAHHHIATKLGQPPQWFAVPFGRINQRICVDILDAIDPLGYQGVLWAGRTSLQLDVRPAPTIRHIFRLHAPTDPDGLEDAIDRMIEPANRRTFAVEAIPPGTHRRPVEVADGDTLGPLRSLERVLREDKLYAVDDRYFAHQFHDNPSRRRPAYQVVLDDGRPEAVLYNFHATFQVAGQPVPGVYLAGWRRLPVAHQVASGLLLRRVTDREAVVGVSDPNPDIAHAFDTWRRIDHTTHHLPATTTPPPGGLEVDVTDRFPGDLADAVGEWSAPFGFTLARCAALYRWRYDSYPLASACHIAQRHHGQPVGYAAVVRCGPHWSISDYLLAPGYDDVVDLVGAVQNLAAVAGVDRIQFRTSNPAHSAAVAELSPTSITGCSYYNLNPDRLTDHGIDPSTLDWGQLCVHDTEVCGDVLPRPATTGLDSRPMSSRFEPSERWGVAADHRTAER